MRNTEQKTAIRRAITAAERPLTAAEILEAAQRIVPAMGIATVYRQIKVLCDEDWIRPVELPGEPARYELASHDHHHHFQCDLCGRVFDVHGCSPRIESGVPDGFRVRTHEVFLYGACADCAP